VRGESPAQACSPGLPVTCICEFLGHGRLIVVLSCRQLEGHAHEDLVGMGGDFGLLESKSFESLKKVAVSSPMTSAALKSASSTGSFAVQIKAPKADVTPPAQMGGLAGSSMGQSFRAPPSPIRSLPPPRSVQTREERNMELRRIREQEEQLNAPTEEKINQQPSADADESENQTETQPSGDSTQPVVRFRTASKRDLSEQHSQNANFRSGMEQVSVVAKRPISKPITVSRRFDAVPIGCECCLAVSFDRDYQF
jgi:hypothetical protein